MNWLAGLYISVLKQSGKLKIWGPFFLYALLQFLLLIVCINYVNPTINSILSPFVSLLGKERAELFGHYPGLYFLLPQVFQWGKLILGIIFEGLAAGITAVLFIRIFDESRRSESPVSRGISNWINLSVTWSIITLILVGVNWLVPQIFSGFLEGSPRRLAMFDLIMRLTTVFLYSIFVYAIPAIVVLRKNVGQALKISMDFFFRYPIFTFFLALLPYLLTVPISYMTSNADLIVTKFSPELVFYILVIGIIVDIIVNFILTGAVVKFLIEEAGE
jgi:hypothetical protein